MAKKPLCPQCAADRTSGGEFPEQVELMFNHKLGSIELVFTDHVFTVPKSQLKKLLATSDRKQAKAAGAGK